MLKLLAPGLKMIDETSIALVEKERSVVLETAKVAMSEDPFGTVAGSQFSAVFQSPLVGLRLQVALPACALAAMARASVIMQVSLVFMFLLSAASQFPFSVFRSPLSTYGTTVSVRSLPSPPS